MRIILDYVSIGTILAPAFRLPQEDLSQIVAEDSSDAISTPMIVYTGINFLSATYSVYVDNVKIAETRDFIVVTKLLLAAFYNLNISYPQKAAWALNFIQQHLVDLQDKVPVVKKLSGFLAAVHTASVGKWWISVSYTHLTLPTKA